MHWPIFVISLKDAADRRRDISRQLNGLKLSFEFIDAIDGREGLPLEFEHKIDREGALTYMRRKMTDGEFACALSHQSVYERLIHDDLPGAIILEDDAILTKEFEEFIRNKGYLIASFIQMDHMHARYFPWKVKKRTGMTTLYPLAKNASLTTGYSITSESARYLLLHSSPIRGTADWPCDITPLEPFVAVPRMVTQPVAKKENSSLEDERRPLIVKRREGRWKRFGTLRYWRHWVRKRMMRPIR